MKKYCMIGLAILAILLLGGCKDTSEPVTQWGYILTEYSLPDPNESIGEGEEAPEEKVYCICGDKVVRISRREKLEGNRYLVTWYFQTLQAPYESWNTDIIEQTIVIDNENYVIGNCCVTPKGDIYLLVYASQEKSFLVKWQDGKVVEKQEVPLDSELFVMNWEMDAQQNSYFYANEYVRVFDSAFQEKQGYDVDGEKLDLIMTPAGEVYAWRMRKTLQGTEGIYSFVEGQELVNGNTLVNFWGRGILATDGDGAFYLADTQRIYQLGDIREELLAYVDLNTWVEEVHDIKCTEEGAFWVLAASGSQRSLLCIEEGMQTLPKKEEVVLAADGNPFLEKCIVDFNKKNEEYYITLQDWDSNQEYYADYCSRLQLEVTTGKGPDLIDEKAIDLESYAKGGYLEPLDDVLEEYEGEFLHTVVESGCIEGKYYVLPYRFQIETLMTLQDIVPGQEGWTLTELQEIAEQNQPKALFRDARAWDIVYICMAWDEEATTFVDWEKGVCYFDGEEFIELLHFAKKYADTEGSSVLDFELQKMQNRDVLLKKVYGIDSWNSYLGTKESLGEEGVFIGYPQENRAGTYVNGIGFVLNSSSKCKEGAKEFLHYLASEEVQNALWEYNTALPVNQKALERLVEEVETENETDYAEEFWRLLDSSKPQGKQYANILDILYEETDAFFSGGKEAEEVAALIQNRVQLYLDEHRN